MKRKRTSTKKSAPQTAAEAARDRQIKEYGGLMADAVTKLETAIMFANDGAPLDAARAANMAITALFAASQKRSEVLGG
jgi:hypothetical protein